MDPDSIHKNDDYAYPDFKIRLAFRNACVDQKCFQNSEQNQNYCANCKKYMSKEIQDWDALNHIVA